MAASPLVSFILVSYNQEKFIRESVRSAFAQLCEPMEIIISDDNSQDRTFDVLREEVGAYCGPHRVVLNRNSVNRGLAGNLNVAWGLATGDFIVIQAGDDLSEPHRVRTLLDAWRYPSPVDLVGSAVTTIDDSSRILSSKFGSQNGLAPTLEQALEQESCCVLGCTLGYSREIVDTFGPIDPTIVQEDRVLSFRALLRRGIRLVDEPLVRYRTHSANISFRNTPIEPPSRKRVFRTALSRLHISRENLRAWDLSGRRDEDGRRRLLDHERRWACEVDCLRSNRFAALGVALGGLKRGLSMRKTAGLIQRHVLRTKQTFGGFGLHT